MLTRFITHRIALTTEIFSSFGKKKIPRDPREWNEPNYYAPLPQATPPPRPRKINGELVQKFDRYSVHPHSYWLTQGKGTERPFTGRYWDTKELGHYTCIVCHQKLFLSDGKYQTPLGMATFWDVVRFAVKLEDDVAELKLDNANITTKLHDYDNSKKRVCCSKCNSHLGTLHHDGPAPTFKRYTINSGAIVFTEKPWFHPPQYYKQERVKNKERRGREKAALHRKSKIESAFIMDKEKFRVIEQQAKPADSNPLSITEEGKEAVEKMKPVNKVKSIVEEEKS